MYNRKGYRDVKYIGFIIYKKDNVWQYQKHTGTMSRLADKAIKLDGEIVPYEGYAISECKYRNKT